MKLDISLLYEKFLSINISNPFYLSEIDARLKTKYSAEELDVSKFDDLKKDPYANYDTIVKAYTIHDSRVIEKLVSLNPPGSITPEVINFLINSSDGIYYSGSTIQGMSNLLGLEASIFGGIKEEDMVLGNGSFEEYLIFLYLLEYIDLGDDILLKETREYYKNEYFI
ncbi:pyruvate kinase [Paenibacillus alvei]|uniref:Pyruvate kinase n=1 Tax=Paenibacillus alvei TaxID=44250 RepID=A0AAP7A594_PAEAL|nr:pyruvate kinase [Paenibacillus alvei]NOJ74127.1 pyruvate kinase [Paenibacillus alvei]